MCGCRAGLLSTSSPAHLSQPEVSNPYAPAGPGLAPAWPQALIRGLRELLYPLQCTARPSAEAWGVEVTGNPARADPASRAVPAVLPCVLTDQPLEASLFALCA